MDAWVSDVVVVLSVEYQDRLDEAVTQLKTAGLAVGRANDDNSVVEGTIETSRLHELEKLDSVRYVRNVFTYEANYPPGDPRDVDRL